jgi:hypothetical protein
MDCRGSTLDRAPLAFVPSQSPVCVFPKHLFASPFFCLARPPPVVIDRAIALFYFREFPPRKLPLRKGELSVAGRAATFGCLADVTVDPSFAPCHQQG